MVEAENDDWRWKKGKPQETHRSRQEELNGD
jgi:hypothetical protein